MPFMLTASFQNSVFLLSFRYEETPAVDLAQLERIPEAKEEGKDVYMAL